MRSLGHNARCTKPVASVGKTIRSEPCSESFTYSGLTAPMRHAAQLPHRYCADECSPAYLGRKIHRQINALAASPAQIAQSLGALFAPHHITVAAGFRQAVTPPDGAPEGSRGCDATAQCPCTKAHDSRQQSRHCRYPKTTASLQADLCRAVAGPADLSMPARGFAPPRSARHCATPQRVLPEARHQTRVIGG